MTNVQPNEATQPSALVIPFPQRPLAPSFAHGPASSPGSIRPEQERLTRALDALNMALAEQRTALKAWRGAMRELKASTVALEGSLTRYQGNLRALGNSVSALHGEARALETWADTAIQAANRTE